MSEKIMRGTIAGKPLYCRIPIRRKRVPLFPDELRDMMESQGERRLSDDDVRKMANELWQADDFEHAGILYSYLDFLDIVRNAPNGAESDGTNEV